jgi:hypothetical protein
MAQVLTIRVDDLEGAELMIASNQIGLNDA